MDYGVVVVVVRLLPVDWTDDDGERVVFGEAKIMTITIHLM